MKRFELSSRDGFHVVFQNGWTFSCQWHEMSYSDKGELTCEIAAWDADGNWFKFPDGQDVLGWVSPDELVDWMKQISMLPNSFM